MFRKVHWKHQNPIFRASGFKLYIFNYNALDFIFRDNICLLVPDYQLIFRWEIISIIVFEIFLFIFDVWVFLHA
jgi:hypothetical protein